MELLLCPCGKGWLIRKVTKKGPNVNRPYYKCPGSSMFNEGCGFFSFVDELMECPCQRGFCRNTFRGGRKYWCCAVQGKDACGHLEMVPTGNTPPSPIQQDSPQITRRRASPTSTGDKRVEAVVRSFEVTRKLNNVLIDLIEDLTILSVNDEESSSPSSTVGTSVEHSFS